MKTPILDSHWGGARRRHRVETERFQDNVVFNTLRTHGWLSTGEVANLTGMNNGAVARALILLQNAGCIDVRMQQNKAVPHNYRGWGSHRLAKKKLCA